VSLYALRILCSHGLNTASLQIISSPSLCNCELAPRLNRVKIASSSGDHQRINAYLRRFWAQDLPTFQQLLEDADQQLFDKLGSNTDHFLHVLLPPPTTASQHYQLRHTAHNTDIPARTGRLADSDFVTRLIYKDTY